MIERVELAHRHGEGVVAGLDELMAVEMLLMDDAQQSRGEVSVLPVGDSLLLSVSPHRHTASHMHCEMPYRNSLMRRRCGN